MKQHIFLRDEYLGNRDIPTWTDIGDSPKLANSYALFCPMCAEIWGKLMHDHPQAYCQVVTSCCVKHAEVPSDATFTVRSRWENDPRDSGGDEWPLSVRIHDTSALLNFYLNHPDKYYL